VDIDHSATQIWSLKESLRKAGACFAHPVSFTSCSADHWASFSAGAFKCATFQASIQKAGTAALAFVVRDQL
jgi:hypothetical protein